MKHHFFFILFWLTKCTLFAQHPVYYHLTEKDELPDIEFYDIIEDKNGFIWLAADKGLYRYDGKNFKNYTHPKKKGLSVFGLQFDDQNRLWCNNVSGQFFYVENDTLHYFTDLKEKNKGQLALFFLKRNKLYANFFNKSFTIDLNTKALTPIFEPHHINRSLFTHNDTIFSAMGDSIYIKTQQGKRTIAYINNLKSVTQGLVAPELKISNIGNKQAMVLQAIDYDKQSKRLFISKQGRFETLNIKELEKDDYIISSLTEKNICWLATKKGVLQYEYINGNFKLLNHLFKDQFITKILKDRNQNYWFTTLRNGVYIIPNINLKLYKNTTNEKISALTKLSDSTFVYGTTKGNLYKKNIYTLKSQAIPSLSNKIVNAISYDQKENLFISHIDKGYTFESYKHKHLEGYPIKFGGAKDISYINEDKFIFGGFAFATIVDFSNKTTKRVGIRRSYTTHFNANNQQIYVGYVDGLEYYHTDLVPHDIRFENKPIFALDLTHTSDNMLWVATFKDGLLGVKNGKVIKNYTNNNGLLSNQTRAIKGDGDTLYIVTDKGIQSFNIKNETFQNITKKDGLSSFNISDILVFKDKVLFNANKGIYELDKNKGFKSLKMFDFNITKVLVGNKETTVKNNYELSSSTNSIRFEFQSNGFLSEEDITYKYRLIGASNEWSIVSEDNNQITFNSLSPGQYTFQIKKVSNINNNETTIKSIKLKVKKPFYKQWWFIGLVILFIIMLMMLYYINKLKEKEKEKLQLLQSKEKEKEVVLLKLENLRSQMNPHFVFNALNSIQDYIMLNEKNLAGDYLGKFADLIRTYLNHSIRANITLEEEVNALHQYLELEKLRFEDTLTYRIITENITTTNIYQIPTMLIQPYVENAIKHGLLHKKTNRKLDITFVLDAPNNIIICYIEDNGIGIERAKILKQRNMKNYSSFATKANQNRLELLNYGRKKKIGVLVTDLNNCKEDKGTKVIINIPYKTL